MATSFKKERHFNFPWLVTLLEVKIRCATQGHNQRRLKAQPEQVKRTTMKGCGRRQKRLRAQPEEVKSATSKIEQKNIFFTFRLTYGPNTWQYCKNQFQIWFLWLAPKLCIVPRIKCHEEIKFVVLQKMHMIES